MNLTNKTVRAGSWLFGHTLIARIGGIIKTAIIARILTPSQFGVFGIATLALGLLETFSETNVDQALIQKKDLNNKDLTAAWVISIFRGFLISAILFLTAPLIGAFFHEPNAVLFIQVIAFAPFIRNFSSPTITLFRRNLDFKKEFTMKSITTSVEVIVGVLVSLWTKNAWGLVAALIAGSISDVILSFTLMPKLIITKPDKASVMKLLKFSGWLWGSSIVSYLVNEGDDIFVGRFLGTTRLAFYQNAFKISSLPATQITGIASQAIYPAFSSIQTDKQRLVRAFKKSLWVTAGLTTATSLAIMFFAKPITLLVLGSQWLEIIPSLQVLTIYGIVRSIATVAGPILKALDRPDVITKFALLRLFVLGAFIYPLTSRYGIVGTSWAVVISTLLPQPYLVWQMKKLLKN